MSAKEIKEMGIHYTFRCSASCRICATSSHPLHPEKMTSQQAADYIQSISRIPSCKLVGFSGGEALMFYEELLELTGFAKSLGLASKIATNAFWAETPSIARRKLEKLRTNGLEFLSISADPYHQEYVPIDRVLNAVRSGLELDMMVTVAYLHKPDNNQEFQSFLENLKIAGFGDQLFFSTSLDPDVRRYLSVNYIDHAEKFKNRIYLRESTPGFCGRAKEFRDECPLFPRQALEENGCYQAGKMMIILPSGNLLMCCTVFAFDNDSFVIGNVDKEGLLGLIQTVQSDPIIECLEVLGPNSVMSMLERKGFRFQKRFSCECHICADLLTRLGRKQMAESLDPSDHFETTLFKAIQERLNSEIERRI